MEGVNFMLSTRCLAVFVAVEAAPVLYGCSSSSGGAATDAGVVADTGSPSADTGLADAGDANALPPWDGAVLGQQCPQTQDTTPCYTCEDDSCCDTQAACLNDPECVAFTSCLNDCDNGVPDDAGVHDSGPPTLTGDCTFYCASAHPEGLTHFAPRYACVQQYCLAQCTGSLPNSCAACVETNCSQQFVADLDTPDGILYNTCGANCASGDATCVAACQSEYPSTKASNMALQACVAAHCATAAACN